MDKITTGLKAFEAEETQHAPLIAFDEAATLGFTDNVLCVTLSAGRFLSVKGEVQLRPVVTAHLRCSRTAAIRLREALDKLLLMTEPQGAKN